MDFSDISFSSVEYFNRGLSAALFSEPSASVFREDKDIMPMSLTDEIEVMPWGGDNQLPFRIIDKIERDETLATCQEFQSEVCYGSGLSYDCSNSSQTVADEVEDFFIDNQIPSYFLGVCRDFKYFGFAVSVIILDREGKRIVRIIRKEACYCRFAPADESGKIPYIVYANFRLQMPTSIEKIDLLNQESPWSDLKIKLKENPELRKFAIVSRIPTTDSTYYPIPYYAALFKGKWFDIKQNIGIAKDASLRNSASLKYHISVSIRYWEKICRAENITDKLKMKARVIQEKQNIIDFLTGAENSGKAIFSEFYVSPDGKEQQDVKIEKIDSTKAGGDWESDIQEAVNMICFTMRVHSNLVGSVPGKAQTNNSGSDKRELYTIAHALQKPYHDILFTVHRIIIRFNQWHGVVPVCPFVKLTTLDEHTDAKTVKMDE